MAFLTPLAALVALLGIAPLIAFAVGERRRQRVAALLRLQEPGEARRLAPALALTALAALVGLAATQPTLVNRASKRVRTDAEAYIVLDTSRSMLASARPGQPNRFARARALAELVRAELADIPTGLASITDRTLPHVLPTANADTFATALQKSMGIERPPPSDGFSVRVTTLGSLAHVATDNFFSPRAIRRLLVVFTDGETKPVVEASIGTLFHNPPPVRTIFVRIGDPSERVFLPSGPDPLYQPDPLSPENMRELADTTGGTALREGDIDRIVKVARDDLGSGPTKVDRRERRQLALAPFVAGLAFLPLGLVLWRRNV